MARRRKPQNSTAAKASNVAAQPPAPDHPASRRSLLAGMIGLFTLAYLARFVTTGGMRAALYDLLLKTYVLIPDDYLTVVWSRWTLGSPDKIAISDRLPIYFVAAVLLLAAWGIGRLLLPRRVLARLTRLETHLFALAVGLNLWSLYVLVLGLLGGLHVPWLLRVPMIAAFAAGIICHRRARHPQPASSPLDQPATPGRGTLGYYTALAIPFVILFVLTAALPPWEFDVREYHLQAPKEWFLAGRIGFVEHNVYANMPLGAEMHALAAMMWMPGPRAWWWGALAGKVVIASYAFLTTVALYAFTKRFFSQRAGVLAALAYLTVPWTFHVSTVGLIEGPVACYLWLSVYAVALAWNEYRCADAATFEGSQVESTASDALKALPATGCAASTLPNLATGRSLLAMSGFLAGASVACKYPGLVFVVIPLSLALAGRLRREHWQALLLFGAMVIAGCGLWFAKNAVLAGNPTYPLLYDIFGGRSWNDAQEARWKKAHGPPRDSEGSRYSASQLRGSLDDLLWNSDKLSPLIIPLAAFAVLVRRHRGLLLALFAFLVFDFLLWWLLTHRYDRFFLPLFPVLAFFAGVGSDWTAARPWRIAVGVFVTWAVLMNLLVIGHGALTGDNRILVPLEILRREPTGLRRLHPAHLYLNDHVPNGSAALLVGEAQPFDLEVPVYWSTCWDDSPLETWFKGRTRAERLEALRRHHISHVFIHWHEINRYRSPGNYGFTDFITREWVHRELIGQQGILAPVPVPTDKGALNPESGEVFVVVYDARPQASDERD